MSISNVVAGRALLARSNVLVVSNVLAQSRLPGRSGAEVLT